MRPSLIASVLVSIHSNKQHAQVMTFMVDGGRRVDCRTFKVYVLHNLGITGVNVPTVPVAACDRSYESMVTFREFESTRVESE